MDNYACSISTVIVATLAVACGGATATSPEAQPAAPPDATAIAAPPQQQLAPVFPPHRVLTVEGLSGIDLFGSTQVTADEIVGAHRVLFEEYGRAVAAGDHEARIATGKTITAAIEAMGDFAYVDLSLIGYYGPKQGDYLTIDLVDEADRAARMSFLAEPTGDIPDPGDVLATWDEYMEKSMPLLQAGEIDFQADCPVFHCIGNYLHPELAPYLPIFKRAAAADKQALLAILSDDKNPDKRASAAFVLAHLDDGDEVAAIMARHLRDPSKLVRNNTLRVLAYIAMNFPTIDLPLDAAITALRYPSTLDRNKASAILSGLAQKPEHRPAIIREAGEVLFTMLQLTQPNNHDFAYEILKSVSGQEYGARDYSEWHAWLEQARKSAL